MQHELGLLVHADFVGVQPQRPVLAHDDGLHEDLKDRLRNSAQVVDHLVHRHANARVLSPDHQVRLVRDDLDERLA
eukprot:6875062-Heterocapsa_arctica.AAC.1